MKFHNCQPGDILIQRSNPSNKWKVISGTPGRYICECIEYNGGLYSKGQIARWEGSIVVFGHIVNKSNRFQQLYHKLIS